MFHIDQIAPLKIQIKQKVFYFDAVLLGIVAALLLLGYVMVVSASLHLGVDHFNDSLHYPIRQSIHLVLGVCAAAAIAYLPLSFWEKAGLPLFLAGLFLLVLVLIPGFGVLVNGAVRWLNVGGVRFQVSEVFKLLTVIYLAGYITRFPQRMQASVFDSFKGKHWLEAIFSWVFSPLGMLLLGCFLLLKEPDFGSAAIVMAIAVGMFFLAGGRIGIFVTGLALLATAGYFLVWNVEYRYKRLTSFQDPFADRFEDGYQLTQALISFGQGETFGVGLGSGVQKLFYLPEGHTDFLLSVIAEELGLVGITLVMLLFAGLVYRAFQIAKKAELSGFTFQAFVAYGIALWFAVQVIVNMGVNMGLLPTKGLTLPLMSYGGGSLITMCMACAFLFRVNHEVHAEPQVPVVNLGGRTWAHG